MHISEQTSCLFCFVILIDRHECLLVFNFFINLIVYPALLYKVLLFHCYLVVENKYTHTLTLSVVIHVMHDRMQLYIF